MGNVSSVELDIHEKFYFRSIDTGEKRELGYGGFSNENGDGCYARGFGVNNTRVKLGWGTR